jgi:hypothetical protein
MLQRRRRTDLTIVDEIVGLLRLREPLEEEARLEIGDDFDALKLLVTEEQLPTGEKRERLRAAARAFRVARNAIDAIPELSRPDKWAYELRDQMDQAAKSADAKADDLLVRRSGGQKDEIKLQSALRAYNLMNLFERKVTRTRGGAYFKIASLFYEAATGQQNENCERACLRYLNLADKDEIWCGTNPLKVLWKVRSARN